MHSPREGLGTSSAHQVGTDIGYGLSTVSIVTPAHTHKHTRTGRPTHIHTNPVLRDFMLMLTKMNLLNCVPQHDCPTFFVIHRTQFKPMHFEWEIFSDFFALHRTTLNQCISHLGFFFQLQKGGCAVAPSSDGCVKQQSKLSVLCRRPQKRD